MKVTIVATELNQAEQYIASLMAHPQCIIVDTRQHAYSHREWAQEDMMRQAYVHRYVIAGEYFWNPYFEPEKLKRGIGRLKASIDAGKDIILLCTHGVHAITLDALRAAVPGVEISVYNGVLPVEAKQQALF